MPSASDYKRYREQTFSSIDTLRNIVRAQPSIEPDHRSSLDKLLMDLEGQMLGLLDVSKPEDVVAALGKIGTTCNDIRDLSVTTGLLLWKVIGHPFISIVFWASVALSFGLDVDGDESATAIMNKAGWEVATELVELFDSNVGEQFDSDDEDSPTGITGGTVTSARPPDQVVRPDPAVIRVTAVPPTVTQSAPVPPLVSEYQALCTEIDATVVAKLETLQVEVPATIEMQVQILVDRSVIATGDRGNLIRSRTVGNQVLAIWRNTGRVRDDEFANAIAWGKSGLAELRGL